MRLSISTRKNIVSADFSTIVIPWWEDTDKETCFDTELRKTCEPKVFSELEMKKQKLLEEKEKRKMKRRMETGDTIRTVSSKAGVDFIHVSIAEKFESEEDQINAWRKVIRGLTTRRITKVTMPLLFVEASDEKSEKNSLIRQSMLALLEAHEKFDAVDVVFYDRRQSELVEELIGSNTVEVDAKNLSSLSQSLQDVHSNDHPSFVGIEDDVEEKDTVDDSTANSDNNTQTPCDLPLTANQVQKIADMILSGGGDLELSSEAAIQPEGGKIVVCSLTEWSEKHPKADHVKLLRSMRSDGYLYNDMHKGRDIIASDGEKITKRYWSLRWEKRKIVNHQFLRYEYVRGPIVIHQYIGDHSLARKVSGVTPHGNSRSGRPFVPTDPLILDGFREETGKGNKKAAEVYRDSVNSGKGPFTTARNLRQVQNVKYAHNESKNKRDEIEELIRIQESVRFGDDEREILSLIDAVRMRVHFQVPGMVDEFIEVARVTGNVMELQYDTQFELGPYYLSTLSFRNTMYEGNPLMPIAYFFSERKFKRDHEHFISDLLAMYKGISRVSIDTMVISLKWYSQFRLNELIRGRHGLGQLCLKAEFSHLSAPASEMPKLSFCPPLEKLVEWVGSKEKEALPDGSSPDPAPVHSAYRSPLISEARALIKGGNVVVKEGGLFLITHRDKVFSVKLGVNSRGETVLHCPCTVPACLHRICCKLYLNLPLEEKRRPNAGLTRRKYKTGRERKGGSKIPRRADKEATEYIKKGAKKGKDNPFDEEEDVNENGVMGVDEEEEIMNDFDFEDLDGRDENTVDGSDEQMGLKGANIRKIQTDGMSGEREEKKGEEDGMKLATGDDEHEEKKEEDGEIPVYDLTMEEETPEKEITDISPISPEKSKEKECTKRKAEDPIEDAPTAKRTTNRNHQQGLFDYKCGVGQCETEIGPTWFKALSNRLCSMALDSSLIYIPSFLAPLPKRYRVIYRDNRGNYGAIVGYNNTSVTIITPSEDSRFLEYLASFITSSLMGDTVEVKRIPSQTVSDPSSQLPLLCVLIFAHCQPIPISKRLFHLPIALTWDSLGKAIRDVENVSLHGRSKTTRFTLFCRCSRPWHKELSENASIELCIPRMIKCSLCDWVWESCQKSIVPSNTRGIKWNCSQCHKFPPIHLWKTRGVTNTCCLDSFLAILINFTAKYSRFPREFSVMEPFEKALKIFLENRATPQVAKEVLIETIYSGKSDLETREDLLLEQLKSTCSTRLYYKYKDCDSEGTVVRNMYEIGIIPPKNNDWESAIYRILNYSGRCRKTEKCGNHRVTERVEFPLNDLFIPIHLQNIKQPVSQLDFFPAVIEVAGLKFEKTGATLHKPGHFTAVLLHDGSSIFYDGMNGKRALEYCRLTDLDGKYYLSTVWYCKMI